MLNDKRQGTAEGRSCWSEGVKEGSCKTPLHAHSNKAVGFNYMNLRARQITDNRVQKRTGRLRGEIYLPVWPRSSQWIRSGRKIHLSLQPSGPIQSRIMIRSNIFWPHHCIRKSIYFIDLDFYDAGAEQKMSFTNIAISDIAISVSWSLASLVQTTIKLLNDILYGHSWSHVDKSYRYWYSPQLISSANKSALVVRGETSRQPLDGLTLAFATDMTFSICPQRMHCKNLVITLTVHLWWSLVQSRIYRYKQN